MQYPVFKLKFFPCYFSVFLLCYLCFYLCLLCFSYYFSFALLIIIRTTERQRTHINKTSNINKFLTKQTWQNQDMTPYWIFRKNISIISIIWIIWSYRIARLTCGVILWQDELMLCLGTFILTKLKLLFDVVEWSD